MWTPLLKQCFIALTTLLASVSAGAAMTYPSVLLYQLKKDDSPIPIDLDSASWIGTMHGLAGIPGIIMPSIMQWKGRKLAFIISSSFVITGWMLIYFSKTISLILISESLQGFGANGLLMVSTTCLNEMIAPKYRNVFLLSYSICLSVGMSIISIMVKYLQWRLVCLVLLVPGSMSVLLALLWPESPFWLAWRGKNDECKRNFRWLRGNDEESMKELKILLAKQEELKKQDKKLKVLKDIFNDFKNRDFYVPCLHIFILYGLIYLSGSVYIIIYAMELIQKTTNNDNTAFIGSVLINFILLFGMIISSFLIKFFRNKTVLLWSAFGVTICLVSITIITYLQRLSLVAVDSNLCVYFLVGHMVAVSLGVIPVASSMSYELMPVKYRGKGGCICLLCTCTLHALSLKISPYSIAFLGLSETFLIYTVNVVVCSFLFWKFVPETKGKTLNEIENFYIYGTFDIKIKKDEAKLFVNNNV